MAAARAPSEAEARKAMTDVIDALTEWRDEVSASSKRFNDVILDKIAGAAETLGWPADMLDATKTTLHEASDAQLKMIDQIADGWKQQLASPLSATVPAYSFGSAPFNPVGLWLKAATAWQKSVAESWQTFADRSKRM